MCFCNCLVLADGYYEWRDADKQPFAVALANRG
jgi:putative SOS response-associated peptidase YedK